MGEWSLLSSEQERVSLKKPAGSQVVSLVGAWEEFSLRRNNRCKGLSGSILESYHRGERVPLWLYVKLLVIF